MPGANLTGRFETHMWYITEPSRTKRHRWEICGEKENRTCRCVGPGGRVVIIISPVPRLMFCSRSHFFWKRQIGIGAVLLWPSSTSARGEQGKSPDGYLKNSYGPDSALIRRFRVIWEYCDDIRLFYFPLKKIIKLVDTGDHRSRYMFHSSEKGKTSLRYSDRDQCTDPTHPNILFFLFSKQKIGSTAAKMRIIIRRKEENLRYILYITISPEIRTDDLFFFNCYPRPRTRKSSVLRIYAFSEHLVDQSSALYPTINMC